MKGIKQTTVLKAKNKQKKGSDIKQKLALHLLQKQSTLLNLAEYLIIASFIIGGVLGRSLMQGFPSVEPITFFAVLSGALFGCKKGVVTGASSWWLSNFFVFGGQGPWSVVHVLSGAVAGYLGSFLHKKPNMLKAVGIMVAATLFFEIAMSISSGFFFGLGILISLISASPFILTHIVSNAGFAFVIPKARQIILEKGKLYEKEVIGKLINKIKNIR